MKILLFAAALRKGSFNRKLVAQAAQILKSKPNLTIDHADFHEFEMPLYDGDLEDASGIPLKGQEFIRRIQATDALIISTPEYNGGIPGILKNAIDWASRARPIPFKDKPLLLLGASPGALGAVRGLWHTRVPFEAIGTRVYPEMFGLPKADTAFDPNDTLQDPKTFKRLSDLLDAYLEFSLALTGR